MTPGRQTRTPGGEVTWSEEKQPLTYLPQKLNDRNFVEFFMVGLIAITFQTVVTRPLTNMPFA